MTSFEHLDAISVSLTSFESFNPAWCSIQEYFNTCNTKQKQMLQGKYGQQRSLWVLFHFFHPGEQGIDLVTCIATNDYVWKHWQEAENVDDDWPRTDWARFLRYRPSFGFVQLENIAASFHQDENENASCAKCEHWSKHCHIAEGHNHLQIIVKYLMFVPLKLFHLFEYDDVCLDFYDLVIIGISDLQLLLVFQL